MRFFVQHDGAASRRGVPMPRAYGVCWRVLDMDAFLICPVPFNVVLRMIRGAWTWIRFPFMSRGCTGYERLVNRAQIAESRVRVLKDTVSELEWQLEHLRAALEKRNDLQSS